MTAATPKNASLWVGLANKRDVDNAALAETLVSLGPLDRQRFGDFRSDKRRQEFLLGRWLLHRGCLEGLEAWPQGRRHVTVDSAVSGAVSVIVAPGQPPIGASLSHSGNWVACVLSVGKPAGIDIEPMVERDFIAMDELAFANENYPCFRELPREMQKREFYRRWTREEARFKALFGLEAPPAISFAEHSCVVDDELMLSLCIAGESGFLSGIDIKIIPG